jgi:hypothetical protein
VRTLGLGQISSLLEALTRLEQVLRQIGPANVHAQPLDQTAAFDNRAARLPERTTFAPTGLDDARRKPQRAFFCLDLAHECSVEPVRCGHIRAVPEFGCGLLLKREHRQRDRAQSHNADQGNHNCRLAAARGVLTHE